MQETLSEQRKVKVHFLIKKKVSYGMAVYVIGNIPELGSWDVSHALRLTWNPDDYWSGFIELQLPTPTPISTSISTHPNPISPNPQQIPNPTPQPPQKIHYKYLISPFSSPTPTTLQWQQGEFNRQLPLPPPTEQNLVIGTPSPLSIENIWNANKICLNLLVPKFGVTAETEVFLAGGCNQLGNWKNRVKMERGDIGNLSEELIAAVRENVEMGDYWVYTVSLAVQRNLRCFNYYFIKQTGNECQPDRIPQRQFKIDIAQNHHPTCLHISTKTTTYQLLQLSKFSQLPSSKITQSIFIGPCIETTLDLKQLKKNKINKIIYLTSLEKEKEGRWRSGPKNLVRMVSQENGVEYQTLRVSIGEELWDWGVLLGEVRDALGVLGEALGDGGNVVYVCCRTGTLLSPLLVSLYLYINGDFSLKRALEYVKQKHPISAIDERIMMLANEITKQRIFQQEIREEEYGYGHGYGYGHERGHGREGSQSNQWNERKYGANKTNRIKELHAREMERKMEREKIAVFEVKTGCGNGLDRINARDYEKRKMNAGEDAEEQNKQPKDELQKI